jgi:hypothetical protein
MRDYGGGAADEALQHLVHKHWERKTIEAMIAFPRDDPGMYADCLGKLCKDGVGVPQSP